MSRTIDHSPKLSLAGQLAELKGSSATRATPDRLATMEAATAKLRASGIETNSLTAGDSAPDVSLPDAHGQAVRLSELWVEGPLVLVFYRGGWCPYCNLELRAWQRLQPELRAAGARLVAISPQTPDGSLSTTEKNELAFTVLSDSGLEAASAFGIAFDLPADVVALYQDVGHDLPVSNGNGRWTLPVPATYVVGKDGTIRFAHVDADYRTRAEPSDVLQVLLSLDGSML